MTSKSEFQQHIHVFRGVAILLIVCAHTLPSLDWSDSPLLGRAIDGIANESSIFFFFIAGYLFQHLSARFRYQSYLIQKLKTVILPYLLLSIPALIVFTFLTERTGMWSWFYGLDKWEQIGLFLLTGKHLAPLWFVPTITLFYLAAPILVRLDRSYPAFYWVIPILLVISSILGRDGSLGPINKALYLAPVYILGMCFSHYGEKAEQLAQKFWLPLSLLTLTGYLGYLLEWDVPPHYLMIMKAPMCLLLTILLLNFHSVFGKRLDYIGHVSFGIFFIHAYFISAFNVGYKILTEGTLYTGLGKALITGGVFNFLIFVLMVTLISVGTIWLMQRIFGKNSRMIIGA
jgi:surface polysaccharide O-acyltransferase-like enzyme